MANYYNYSHSINVFVENKDYKLYMYQDKNFVWEIEKKTFYFVWGRLVSIRSNKAKEC